MEVRGIDLAWQERGQGVPFFWGHGLIGCMAQEDDAGVLDWGEIARAARLLRYDARGHGRSEATLDPADYRWGELAADLLALADACGAERAVWGGLSMGCATALHAAAANPGRTEGLVLVAPPTAWRTRPRQARLYRTLAAVIERVGLGAFRFAACLGELAPGPRHLKRLQRSVVRHLSRADARAVVCALRGAAESDLPDAEALGAVAAPALILAWRGDPAHPLSSAERLVEILPAAELHVAGSLEEVQAWSPRIRHFLAGLKPSRPTTASPPHA
jgi:3-oxoadipate enol-lactonase